MNQRYERLRVNWGWVDEVIQALAVILELRDLETGGHTQRVAYLSWSIGEQMGLDSNQLVELRRVAYLHDLGKIAIPDQILRKPQRLTPAEWEIVRRHPTASYLIASSLPGLSNDVLNAVLHHHERWNGQGYPSGLARDQIHWAARIFAVADSVDAMVAGRVYQQARPLVQAQQEIRELCGDLYDPEVVDAFLHLPEEVLDQWGMEPNWTPLAQALYNLLSVTSGTKTAPVIPRLGQEDLLALEQVVERYRQKTAQELNLQVRQRPSR